MKTDQARIVIRERTWTEILDLSLQVLRTHFSQILLAAAVGIVPLAIVNVLLVSNVYTVALGLEGDAFMASIFLVMIEAPLGTAVLTLYLGQAMFTPTPDLRRIARELAGSLPQLIGLQFFVRIVLIVPVLTWIVPYAVFPYLNEVILLERYPLFAPAGQLSTMHRISALNRGGSGDYIVRAMVAGLLSLALVVALWTSLQVSWQVLLGVSPTPLVQLFVLQGVLWGVAVYFTVARFLSYVDQRIRYEGWEMELALRAQRERLLRPAA